MVKLTKWRQIRITLIGIFLIITSIAFPTIISTPPMNLIGFLVVICMCFIGGILFMWKEFSKRKSKWSVISWDNNPFSMKSPISELHFSGWVLIISFIAPSLKSLIEFPQYYLDALLPLSCGIMIILASLISCFLFCSQE